MATTTLDPPKTTTPLPLFSSPVLTQDGRRLPSHGKAVCSWIERNYRLGKGDYYGRPFRLTSYQRRWVWRLNEFYPETIIDGDPYTARLRYKRATFGTGKGNGKTPFEGALGGEGLMGPTAPYDPLVLMAAAALEQSNIVFADMKIGITHESSPLAPFVLPFELSVQLIDRPGEVKRVAAVAGSNDGPRATKLLADELHEWLGPLREVHMVLDGAVGKRVNAQNIGISTAGSDKNSLLGEMYDRGRMIASGEIVDDETLFEWFEIPDTIEVPEKILTEADLEQWRAAVLWANPALAEASFLHWDYVRSRFDGAQTIERARWLRYHGNQWTKTESIWLPPGAWSSRAKPEVKVQPGEDIVLAFSGTYDNDSAALVGCTFAGHVFEVDGWENSDGVPRDVIENALQGAMQTLRPRRLVINPMGWHTEAAAWVKEFGRKAVLFDWNHQLRRRADACSRFFTGVATGSLSHDGSPGMARHLAAATPRNVKEGTYIARRSREDDPIDRAVAAVMAHEQAMALGKRRGGGFVGITV